MRVLRLFSLAVLCSAAVVLAQSSSSEAPYVCDALFARSLLFGKDTSGQSAIDLDVSQHPKDHPTAAASIHLNTAFAASFKPEDGVITDPEVFSEFEAQVPRVSAALQLVEIRKKIVSLARDCHQLACEIRKQYDFSRAVTDATAFHGPILRFVAKNPWRNPLDHFLERMSSEKDQGRPDDNDKPSTYDGIYKGIQDFFSSIGGIFEGIRGFFAGTAGLLISTPEYIGNFSQIFKSIVNFFTFILDLIARGFHALAVFFSETDVPLLICARRLLPYVFGLSLAFGLGLPLIISGGIFALGFTPQGIAVGSIAALCMSFCHPIASGGLVAVLQSRGTLGILAGFPLRIVLIGIASGCVSGLYLRYDAVCSA